MRERSVDHDALSAEEAERIVRHAGQGALDLNDPEIRRMVSTAQRTLARHTLWGDGPASRRRLYLALGAAFLALWVVGLAVPLMSAFVWTP